MNFVVYGAGSKGRRIARLLQEKAVAFIDSDEKKVGTNVDGLPVINLDEYLLNLKECVIIISPNRFDSCKVIEQILREKNIFAYVFLIEASADIEKPHKGFMWNDLPLNTFANEKYAIYGMTLTGLLWYDELRKRGCKDVIMVPHATADCQTVAALKSLYGEVNFGSVTDLNHCNRIFLTVPCMDRKKIYYAPEWFRKINTDETLYKSLQSYSTVVDLYDIRASFPDRFYNPEIEKFKNIHIGERCFIIGNGPSLSMNDLETIKQHEEYSMGVGNIFVAFSDTSWRPTYYVSGGGDGKTINLHKDDLLNMDVRAKFFAHHMIDAPDCFLDKREKFRNIYRYMGLLIPGFSGDFARGTYGACSIIIDCIQLAVYMGFKEIFILGVDFDYSYEIPYFSKKYIENEVENHVIDLKKEAREYPYERTQFEFILCKQYSDDHGIKIYNSTRGGKLEIFPRVNFDDLF